MPKQRTWTNEQLKEAIESSLSWSQVITKLGLKAGGGTYEHLKKVASDQDYSFDHFTGKGWNTGSRFRRFNTNRRELSEYLKKDGVPINSNRLRKRLLKEGFKEEKCESCGLREWQGEKIPLELDHINGDNKDNRLENLRILCPNCHAQTDTYCGKNKK